MGKLIKPICGIALIAASNLATAADFDGSAPLLCAVIDTVSCDRGGECVRGPATAVNLPVFFSIDIENKMAQSTRESGEQGSSKILSVHKQEQALVLLGVEEGSGWSATLSRGSGKITVSTEEEDIGHVIFGACHAR